MEDTATVLLRFANGMLGSLHVGYLLPEGTQTYWGLRGSLGWARHDFQDERRFTVHSTHPDSITAPTKYYDFPVPPNATYGRNSAQALLLDFVRCIRQGACRRPRALPRRSRRCAFWTPLTKPRRGAGPCSSEGSAPSD